MPLVISIYTFEVLYYPSGTSDLVFEGEAITNANMILLCSDSFTDPYNATEFVCGYLLESDTGKFECTYSDSVGNVFNVIFFSSAYWDSDLHNKFKFTNSMVSPSVVVNFEVCESAITFVNTNFISSPGEIGQVISQNFNDLNGNFGTLLKDSLVIVKGLEGRFYRVVSSGLGWDNPLTGSLIITYNLIDDLGKIISVPYVLVKAV